MMTRWRMRTIGPNSINVYASFDLFPDMSEFLDTIGARPLFVIGVIIFKNNEDITLFRVKYGV